MIFVAPHNSDWEHIVELTGDKSWSPRRMRKYFKLVERCNYVGRPWSPWWNRARHGFDGWLPTTMAEASVLLRDLVLCRIALAAIQTCFDRRVTTSPGFMERMQNWAVSFLDPSD
jgi:choline dehydrogenase